MSANAELLKGNHHRLTDNYNFFTKYKLSCQDRLNSENPDTRDWLELVNKMKYDSPGYAFFKGLLEKKKAIVVKIGPIAMIEKEYNIGEALATLKLPTFLTYHCIIHCLEDIEDLKKSMPRYLCRTKGNLISILVMPELIGGVMKDYEWSKDNFYIMQNIFKHVVLSILYASTRIGFNHRDLHIDNVRLVKTKRQHVDYEEFGRLELYAIMPVIMDYNLSLINSTKYSDVYKFDILRYINSCHQDLHGVFNTNNYNQLISKISWDNTKPTPADANKLLSAIDKFIYVQMRI